MASLIFWAVTIIVTVKYVGLVMSADNDGEGGIMALISQVRQIGDVSSRTSSCWPASASSGRRSSSATA